MDCARNEFCKQLPPESREKLCANCRRRFFKAQSIQMRYDYLQNCMMLLDGCLTTSLDLGASNLDHDNEIPALYVGFPGRLLNLDITFGFEDLQDSLEYAEYYYLTDTWVASFSHHIIRKLCDTDSDFRHAVLRNMTLVETDCCQMMALFRPGYTYYGVRHLTEMLANNKVYLTQQQLAQLMSRDRTSISKAVARLKSEHPDLWEAYVNNKGRELTRPMPGASARCSSTEETAGPSAVS